MELFELFILLKLYKSLRLLNLIPYDISIPAVLGGRVVGWNTQLKTHLGELYSNYFTKCIESYVHSQHKKKELKTAEKSNFIYF